MAAPLLSTIAFKSSDCCSHLLALYWYFNTGFTHIFNFSLPRCNPRSREESKETEPRVHIFIYTPSRNLKQSLPPPPNKKFCGITHQCFAGKKLKNRYALRTCGYYSACLIQLEFINITNIYCDTKLIITSE